MIPTTRASFSDSRPVGFSSVNSPLPQTNPSSYNHGGSAANYSPAHQNYPGSQNPMNNHLNASGTFRGLNNFGATQNKQLGSSQIQSSFMVSPCSADTSSSPVANLFDRMNQSSVSNNFFPNDLSMNNFGVGGGDIRHSPIQTDKPLVGHVPPLHSGSSQGDLFRYDRGQVSVTPKGVPEMPQLSDHDNVSTCQSLHTVAPRYQWRFPEKSLKIQAVENPSVSNKDTDLHTLSSPSDGYSSGKASIGGSYSKIVSSLELDSGIDQDFTESEEPLPCDRKTEQVLSWNGNKSSSYNSTTLPQSQNVRDAQLTVFTRDAAPIESSGLGTSEFVNKTYQYPAGNGGMGSLPCRVKNQTLVTVQKPVGPTEALVSSGRSEVSNPLTSLKFQKASSEAARRAEERPIGSVLQIKNNSSELPVYDGPRLISMEKIRDNLDTGSLSHSTADANEKTNAWRLARRLYELDGFRKSDVAKHLGKRSDFAQLVRQAYLQQFDFSSLTLDVALRNFLTHLVLSGETQERERILAEFSRRFVECNPHIFGSQDSCHMLVCGIMLLNTDLHGESDRKKMTVHEFVENLSGLNGGANFPKDLLKSIYNSIKNQPIEFATDEADDNSAFTKDKQLAQSQANPFLDVPDPSKAREFKAGYLMRKCCLESDGRRMPLGKRGWKMFYASLRDLVLYLLKDEHSFGCGATIEDTSNAIRIHHSLATDASDYAKRQYVFRVRAADWSEYLFQASNGDDCQAWIDAINQAAAALSAPPLPGAVGSQMKFQRPLMPSTRTKLLLKDQLAQHQQTLVQTEKELAEHREFCPEKGSRQRTIQDFLEKEAYLDFEKLRFQTYCTAIEKQRTKASQASGQAPRNLKDGSDCFEADGEKRNLSSGMSHAASVPHYLGHYQAKSVPVLFESRV